MNIEVHVVENNWKKFTLANQQGMIVELLDYGGIITNISTPNKNGDLENIVLGYKHLNDYIKDKQFLGAIIGPVAGRIENAEFTLEDKQYNFEKNDGNHLLHCGTNGLHRVIWDASPFKTNEVVGVKLSYSIKNEEDNLPGNRKFHVTYSLTNENKLIIRYFATTDKTTYMTLTNHTYFNLTGSPENSIQDHKVTIASDHFAELNEQLIPNGKISDVTNTVFNFTTKQKLRYGMISSHPQNKIVGNGFDHYFMFDNQEKDKVQVEEPTSGRTLNIQTTQPGMVMYTANSLDEGLVFDQGVSHKYGGVCFETQGSPAAIFHDTLPSILLGKGKSYESETIFSFGVK